MRSSAFINEMTSQLERYGFLDDVNDVRWIFDISVRDRGVFTIYKTNCQNVAMSTANCYFGHQDTVGTILARYYDREFILDPPEDLCPKVCP